MTGKATQALYRAWGAFAATPLPAEAPEAAGGPSEPSEVPIPLDTATTDEWDAFLKAEWQRRGMQTRADIARAQAALMATGYTHVVAGQELMAPVWQQTVAATAQEGAGSTSGGPQDVVTFAGERIAMAPPQDPFAVERMGDGVLVRVTERPLTLLEAQDLTARLMVVTTPMWSETLPKERI